MFKDFIELGENKISFDMTEKFVDYKEIQNLLKEYNKIAKTKKDSDIKEKYRDLNEMLYKFISYYLTEEEYNKLLKGYKNGFMYNSIIVTEILNTLESQTEHLQNINEYFTNFIKPETTKIDNENEGLKEDK